MIRLLSGAAALGALAIVGFSGTAQAYDCAWEGNYWNCGDRLIYPKSYPWGTALVNGQHSRPPSPPESDVLMSPFAPPQR